MTLVVDASAFIQALVHDADLAVEIRDSIADGVMVPDHMQSECAQTIRGLFLGGKISGEHMSAYLDEIAAFPFTVIDFGMYVGAGKKHYSNLSAYDAAYLAIAELADAPLMTLNAGLREVASKHVTVLP